jgi:glucose/arabinose dehydrogenase
MRRPLATLAALATGLAACAPVEAPPARAPTAPPTAAPAAAAPAAGAPDAGTPATPPGARAGLLPREIRTEALTPVPLRVRVEDLPAPGATASAERNARVVEPPADPVLRVPAGFRVNVWAEGLQRPRWLALTPDGDVLLAESYEHRVRLLRDTDGDGAADETTTFADARNGLDLPHGMAFAGGYVFVGNTGEVLRFPYRPGQARLDGRGEHVVDLPGQGYNQHWTRNVVALPSGDALAVSVGSESNADVEELPRASVFRVGLDGGGRETLASGMRNPVGLAVEPRTGALYATVNERDGLGDDLVPDYLAEVAGGAFYGWPFAYLTPEHLDPRHVRGGRSARPELAARTQTPAVLFQAHSAALGLAFYPLDGPFPARYHGGAFVAMRGSWNRSRATGYKLAFVPFDAAGRPAGFYEDFLAGFLLQPGSDAAAPLTWGRPVGLLVLPDGSLLFTEEMNGRIYRVSYGG